MEDESLYILYGSYASYATAETRSYLRKKGIPFVERLPASKRFWEYVRPTSENHRIPQLEAPDGNVVQDTKAIFDFLEERFSEPATMNMRKIRPLAPGRTRCFSRNGWPEAAPMSVFQAMPTFRPIGNRRMQTPFFGIETGHTRQYVSEGKDAPVAKPVGEAMTVKQMVDGYTRGGAYQMGAEDEIGTLEVGKKTDFIVLDANMFDVAPHAIHEIKPTAVIMNGNRVSVREENPTGIIMH